MRNDVPAAIPLIFFVSGLAAGPFLASPFRASLSIALAAALVLCLRRGDEPARRVRAAGALLLLALGILVFARNASRVERERAVFQRILPDRFVQLEVPLERDWAARDESFVLRSESFLADGEPFDTPIAVYVRFEPPEMDMEATLRAEGFLRQSEWGHYIFSIKAPQLMSYEGRLAWWHPAAWNRALANRLEQHAEANPDEVALAQALLLGRGERLTDEMRDSFRRGGTYHLLVFSALQIAFAAGIIAALLRWLHAPRASDWLLLLFAVLAPLFIGPTASVSRASIGIGLYACSRIAKRPTSLENLWCLAALVRLMLDPRELTDVSFHLTYAGAGALLFIGKPWRQWVDLTGRVRKTPGAVLHHAAATEIAISPLTLFHFNQYTLGGSMLTLAMSPLIFAMLIASSIACAFPAQPVFYAISLLHRLCGMLNALGLSGFHPAPPLGVLIAGSVAALLFLAFLRARKRAVAIALALLLPSGAAVAKSISLRSVDSPLITFFDVGQGDAAAIRSRGGTAVIDTGRGRQILRLLGQRGVRRIDSLFLSHAHPDHCDGIPALIENFDVRAVRVSPRRFRGECATRILAACMSTGTAVHLVRDGDRYAVGDVQLTAVVADLTFRQSPENNASLVLRAEADGRRVLFTGDLEREGEIYLSDQDLKADVLKAGHHGSRTSSSRYLLDVVNPRSAVISCGRRNLFGHPHQSVLDDFAARRIRVWRTDGQGTLDLEIRNGNLYLQPAID
ncbi:MAG TPA: DNA internalization-related competence protein ComEC/Rec2 [Thermoanaerobaculia bacterium]